MCIVHNFTGWKNKNESVEPCLKLCEGAHRRENPTLRRPEWVFDLQLYSPSYWSAERGALEKWNVKYFNRMWILISFL